VAPIPFQRRLRWIGGERAVCRLESGPLPEWVARALDADGLVSVTRTAAEVSVVCAQERVPGGVRAERGWRALEVEGPLDFGMVGVLAELTGVLAAAGVPIFAISTFDTDYLLVRSGDAGRAAAALRSAEYEVTGDARTEGTDG